MTDASPRPEQRRRRTSRAAAAGRIGVQTVRGVVRRAGHQALGRFGGGRGAASATIREHDLTSAARATDVLVDGADADEARDTAKSLGLGWSADATSAWAALGALAAVVRFADDGHRAAVVIEESGSHSPMRRWACVVGFAPVDLPLTTDGERGSLDLDPCSIDVITRLHPHGCLTEDIDAALLEAAVALRPAGLFCVTLPLGSVAADGAVGVAEIRGVIARAGDLGLVLVGELSADQAARIRSAQQSAAGTAYGLVRLTFRRR